MRKLTVSFAFWPREGSNRLKRTSGPEGQIEFVIHVRAEARTYQPVPSLVCSGFSGFDAVRLQNGPQDGAVAGQGAGGE